MEALAFVLFVFIILFSNEIVDVFDALSSRLRYGALPHKEDDGEE